MSKHFRLWKIDEVQLLPPSVQDYVGKDHLSRLIVALVRESLDLSEIAGSYRSGVGQPPFDPWMMTALLLHGYASGVYSSRRIAKAAEERADFMMIVAGDPPDFRTISDFRKRHLEALAGLFVQVLQLCQGAGLVKLGHVALDGTKLKAHASKHKAMSYARMEETEARLEREVRTLLAQAQQVDAAEDTQYGRGRRGDELPAELARRESRLAKIRAAKAALEQEAKARAAQDAEAARTKLAAREQRVGSAKGGVPKVPDPEQARPEPTAPRNFTDPESRIMTDGATKAFVQGYNAQLAVDAHAQVIVACDVTQAASDVEQFVPMLTHAIRNVGQVPAIVLADAGYFSAANLTAPELTTIDCYVP